MNRIHALLMACIMALGLVVVTAPTTAASGTFPTFEGSLHGDYVFCAPAQTNCVPPNWNKYKVSCIKNQDDLTYNVGIGFRVQGTKARTYQGILLRKWTFCATDTGGKIRDIVVGPGWCLGYTRWTSRVEVPSGNITYFAIPLASRNVNGYKLPNFMMYVSTANLTHYTISGYLC